MKSKSLKVMIAAVSTFVFLNTSVFAATEQTLSTETENSTATTEIESNDAQDTAESTDPVDTTTTEDTTIGSEDTDVSSNGQETAGTENTDTPTGEEETAGAENTDIPTNEEETAGAENTDTPTDEEGTTDESDNTSVDKAKFIDINSIEYGNMTAEGQQRWFLTQAPAGKVTVYLQNSAPTMNLNVYLFKYDTRTGSVEQVASTLYSFGAASKQLSYVSDEEAYYFIGVNTEEGYVEDNSYALALVYSNNYDSAEADDTLDKRQIFSEVPASITQSIDNSFDTDWTQFTLAENKAMHISFNNTGSKGTYVMKIYDANLNLVKKLNQGESFDSTFAAGTYYMEVYSSDWEYDTDSPEYNIGFVKYDNIVTRKQITSLPRNYKDSINNQYDQKWFEYTPSSNITTIATLSNPDGSTNYGLGIFTADENGNLVQKYGLSQNGHYSVSLTAGTTYYIGVLSTNNTYNPNSKFTINFTQYNTSQNLLAMSNDGYYIVTTDSDKKNLYINGQHVNLSWQRQETYNYGGGCYQHIDQEIDATSSSEITAGGFGTYRSSKYGTINHAVGINVTDLNYFYYFYAYYNGQSPSDNVSDHIKLPVAQTLIIDADTCQVVDWNSNLNYHYANNQETHVFTQEN